MYPGVAAETKATASQDYQTHPREDAIDQGDPGDPERRSVL
jgi:hypothetical protein